MSENTAIEWADHTFNPWEGCTKVGPGCDHCYAEARNIRFGGGVALNWGPGAPRRRTSAANWAKPILWNSQAATAQRGWEACLELAKGDEAQLLEGGYFKPQRPRVFCASLADVFDNEVPDEWRRDLFALIRATPNLDWLLLTKRIGNVEAMVRGAQDVASADANRDLVHWLQCWMDGRAPFNVWLGVTIVNQAEANRDISKLLAVPASVRFLSMEPLLGAVDLTCVAPHAGYSSNVLAGTRDDFGVPIADLDAKIDWVIVGGESGPQARPSHPDWFRSLRDQCAAAGVPFLFKQWGEWWEVDSDARDDGTHVVMDPDCSRDTEHFDSRTDALVTADGHRFTPETLPVDTAGRLMSRCGKKAAGRLLDGVQHNGFPESRR